MKLGGAGIFLQTDAPMREERGALETLNMKAQCEYIILCVTDILFE